MNYYKCFPSDMKHKSMIQLVNQSVLTFAYGNKDYMEVSIDDSIVVLLSLYPSRNLDCVYLSARVIFSLYSICKCVLDLSCEYC